MSPQAAPDNRYDVAIIGAGHNGLTCACYLAKRGLKVGMFERRHVIGGAAVTEEFHPGFRNSTASYTVSLLHPQIIRDLHLHEHGLRIVERPLQNYLPLPNGSGLRIGPTLVETGAALAAHSARDAARLHGYHAHLDRAVSVLRDLMLRTPPTDLNRLSDIWSALRAGNAFRRLPIETQRTVLELFTRSAGDVLDGWFESDAIKAVYGFDAIVGNYASPYSPGSAYVLLHHALGEVNGKRGTWGHAIGGMGSITQAMASEARSHGVHIETSQPVKRVVVENGHARGLELDDGRTIRAGAVAANVDPRTLFLRLLDSGALPAEFVARMQRYRAGSASFRLNVALAQLPRLDADALASGIIIGPSLAYMDRAYTDARAAGWSKEPVIELLFPSTLDDSLAPPGAHVASLFCQHFAPHLPDGRSWEECRPQAMELIIDTVEHWLPGFHANVLGVSALSPLDLEQRLGLANGDIFHGALGLDQIWAARPILGHGDYRTPVLGLYLCGAGAHPGGGVSGIPGRNCAREMLRDGRRSAS